MKSTNLQPLIHGQRIKTLRQQNGMRVESLAHHAQISATQIYRLESDTRPHASAVTLARVAQVLGTSLEYLLGLTDDPSSFLVNVTRDQNDSHSQL